MYLSVCICIRFNILSDPRARFGYPIVLFQNIGRLAEPFAVAKTFLYLATDATYSVNFGKDSFIPTYLTDMQDIPVYGSPS